MAPCRCNFSTVSCRASSLLALCLFPTLRFDIHVFRSNYIPRLGQIVKLSTHFLIAIESSFTAREYARFVHVINIPLGGEIAPNLCKRISFTKLRWRNAKSPWAPFSIWRRQVRTGCSCLFLLTWHANLPFLLSFSLILRWIRRCPVHWHLSKDSGFSLRTWQLRARGAKQIRCRHKLADVSRSLSFFFSLVSS